MENENQPSRDSERQWWQWVLIYPTLIVSLFGSFPTLMELYTANKLDVEFGTVKQAKEQQDMWEKNLECTIAPFDWLKTPTNTLVDATICRSGDVFVRVKTVEHGQFYRWVSVDGTSQKDASIRISLFNQLVAEPLVKSAPDAQNSVTVLCQRWVKPGHLLRRLQIEGEGCFDEVVNTYNGAVISNTPAPCDSQC